VPVYWPGGTRRRDGVSLVCCSCTEREKASVDTVDRAVGVVCPPVDERERAEAETVGTEYRGGVSLADRPAVAVKSLLSGGGGGAKGSAHQDC
jgi:hypothetical protein